MRLADGCSRTRLVLVTRVDVLLQDRIIPTTFIVFPDTVDNNTLGIDFVEDAKVTINVSDRVWTFSDKLFQKYELLFEASTLDTRVETLSVCALGPDEGQTLQIVKRNRLNELLNQNSEVFAPSSQPTPFAEHYINTGDHPPIALPPYRMHPVKAEILRKQLDKLLEEQTIEECESAWAATAATKNGRSVPLIS